jgi:preprotein translocase SecE subunit
MARETRRQRRAARAAAGDGAQQTSRRSRAAQVRPSQQPVKQQTGRKSEKQRGQFIRESYAELKKVDWPTRRQTFQGVIVVLIACTIVGVYLWGLDQVIRPFVDRVLL